jgi:hypothetical protein
MKKKESNNHLIKRMLGYLAYRKQKTYRYNLKDLISYRKYQDSVLKEEGFYDWDVTLKDGLDEL